MRGLLSFLILWLLSRKPMYGQEIAMEIAKRKGEKPTPGTLYPALKDLKKRGLIKVERKNRKTVYKLTDKGKHGIGKACEYFCTAFGEIFEEWRKQFK
ncbi:MAG: PadR family transcriptional regulator [Euryarchaeota archaeon]|nr:PadR family transcriptional regulator [Euryarchaeota archaeon]